MFQISVLYSLSSIYYQFRMEVICFSVMKSLNSTKKSKWFVSDSLQQLFHIFLPSYLVIFVNKYYFFFLKKLDFPSLLVTTVNESISDDIRLFFSFFPNISIAQDDKRRIRKPTVFDNSLPISIVRRHRGIISVDRRKLMTSVSSTWKIDNLKFECLKKSRELPYDIYKLYREKKYKFRMANVN